jgi:hypothetical protein
MPALLSLAQLVGRLGRAAGAGGRVVCVEAGAGIMDLAVNWGFPTSQRGQQSSAVAAAASSMWDPQAQMMRSQTLPVVRSLVASAAARCSDRVPAVRARALAVLAGHLERITAVGAAAEVLGVNISAVRGGKSAGRASGKAAEKAGGSGSGTNAGGGADEEAATGCDGPSDNGGGGNHADGESAAAPAAKRKPVSAPVFTTDPATGARIPAGATVASAADAQALASIGAAVLRRSRDERPTVRRAAVLAAVAAAHAKLALTTSGQAPRGDSSQIGDDDPSKAAGPLPSLEAVLAAITSRCADTSVGVRKQALAGIDNLVEAAAAADRCANSNGTDDVGDGGDSSGDDSDDASGDSDGASDDDDDDDNDSMRKGKGKNRSKTETSRSRRPAATDNHQPRLEAVVTAWISAVPPAVYDPETTVQERASAMIVRRIVEPIALRDTGVCGGLAWRLVAKIGERPATLRSVFRVLSQGNGNQSVFAKFVGVLSARASAAGVTQVDRAHAAEAHGLWALLSCAVEACAGRPHYAAVVRAAGKRFVSDHWADVEAAIISSTATTARGASAEAASLYGAVPSVLHLLAQLPAEPQVSANAVKLLVDGSVPVAWVAGVARVAASGGARGWETSVVAACTRVLTTQVRTLRRTGACDLERLKTALFAAGEVALLAAPAPGAADVDAAVAEGTLGNNGRASNSKSATSNSTGSTGSTGSSGSGGSVVVPESLVTAVRALLAANVDGSDRATGVEEEEEEQQQQLNENEEEKGKELDGTDDNKPSPSETKADGCSEKERSKKRPGAAAAHHAVPSDARALAFATLGKLCLQSPQLARRMSPVIVRQLEPSGHAPAAVRANALLSLCDLCVRYPALVDRYLPALSLSICDESVIVRRQALAVVTRLVSNGFMKLSGKGLLTLYASRCVADSDATVRSTAAFHLEHSVMKANGRGQVANGVIEALFVLNRVKGHALYPDEAGRVLGLDGPAHRVQRAKIYGVLTRCMGDEDRIQAMGIIARDVLAAAAEACTPYYAGGHGGGGPRSSPTSAAAAGSNSTAPWATDLDAISGLLEDAMGLMASPMLRLRAAPPSATAAAAASAASAPGGAGGSAAASGNLLHALLSKLLPTALLPPLLEVLNAARAHRHPLGVSVVRCICMMHSVYPREVGEWLGAAGVGIRAEIEYELQRARTEVAEAESSIATADAEAAAAGGSPAKKAPHQPGAKPSGSSPGAAPTVVPKARAGGKRSSGLVASDDSSDDNDDDKSDRGDRGDKSDNDDTSDDDTGDRSGANRDGGDDRKDGAAFKTPSKRPDASSAAIAAAMSPAAGVAERGELTTISSAILVNGRRIPVKPVTPAAGMDDIDPSSPVTCIVTATPGTSRRGYGASPAAAAASPAARLGPVSTFDLTGAMAAVADTTASAAQQRPRVLSYSSVFPKIASAEHREDAASTPVRGGGASAAIDTTNPGTPDDDDVDADADAGNENGMLGNIAILPAVPLGTKQRKKSAPLLATRDAVWNVAPSPSRKPLEAQPQPARQQQPGHRGKRSRAARTPAKASPSGKPRKSKPKPRSAPVAAE